MRSVALLALLAGAAVANPVPQDFEWDAIADLDPVPTPEIPVVNAQAAATTVPYNTATAAASVTAAINADPTDSTLKVRDTADTAEAFLATQQYQTDSLNAVTPSGYTLVYQNKTGSSERIFGYMGFDVLSSYDPAVCTARCTKISGCSSVNLYYERDPSVDPTDSNPNPPSQVVIKCVYWGGPVTSDSPTNVGQYRKDFHVVISGSNGYVSKAVPSVPGYQPAVTLGTYAINAPLDCNKQNPYMGVKIFTDGPFDAGKCAAACSAQSDYNRRYPAKNGFFQTCQFFNTYVLYNNTVPVGQYCSLYNETWPAAFATNSGQYRGKDKFTINYSFAYSNTTGGLDKPVGCTNKASP